MCLHVKIQRKQYGTKKNTQLVFLFRFYLVFTLGSSKCIISLIFKIFQKICRRVALLVVVPLARGAYQPDAPGAQKRPASSRPDAGRLHVAYLKAPEVAVRERV